MLRGSRATLFTRQASVGRVALGDTNVELARPTVDPRRERMDDPQYQTDDARTFEPRPVVAGTSDRPHGAALFRRQAKKGDLHDEVTLTITLNRAALAEIRPLLEDLQRLGDLGCSRSVIIEDWTEDDDGGNTTHGFDGDGPSKIFDIKVTEGKKALVDQHRTPKFAPPREDQRTHLDEEVKRDMENDPDLKKEASGRLFP